MHIFRFLPLLSAVFLISSVSAQSLRINEVSQGPSGSQEYVELLVTGPVLTNCSDVPPCLDLRGWILDDNNGYFSNGNLTGTGLAGGAVRFANVNFWSCVKSGTIILIYNDADPNGSVPADDQDPNDGNCRLVLPISSTLFDQHTSSPSTSSMAYATTGWISGGSWTPISMANGGDSFQVYAPANTTVPVHGVSWGNNNSNNFIYFSGAAGGLVFSCTNTNSADLSVQSNWISASAASGQTPGLPNSTQNSALVSGMNLNCSAPLVVTVNPVSESCTAACSGSATVTVSGGQAPYQTPVWSNGTTANQVSNLCAGSYSVEVVDANGCSSTENFTIAPGSAFTVSTSGNVSVCSGQTTTISASGATSYTWNNGLGAGASFQVSPTTTTTYTVTGTTAGCSASASLTVTVNALPNVNAGPDQGICEGNTVVLTATGADTYVWTNGVTNGQAFTPPAGTTVYTVTGTANGCTATDQVTVVSSASLNVSAGLDQTICLGESAILVATGAVTYSWTGGVVNNQPFSPAATTTYTVTGTSGNCTGTDNVTITVNPIPQVNAGADQTVCTGGVVVLTATGADSYVWTNGLTNGVGFIPTAGTVTYTVTGSTDGCSATDQVTVTATDGLLVNAGPDLTVCSGDEVVLTATGADQFTWTNGIINGQAFIPAASINTYIVSGVTGTCTGQDEVIIIVTECAWQLEMPNVFTPNGDNANDLFVPVNQENILVKRLEIFNRWGNLLMASDAQEIVWDGKSQAGEEASDGVYFYKLTFVDGKDVDNTVQGFVHLIRK